MTEQTSASAATSQAKGPRAAVIGLGSMGFGMAVSLLRAGFDVAGYDVGEDAVARLVGHGGRGAASAAEAATGAEIVVSVVVNAAQTEAVLFGENGVAAAMPVALRVHVVGHHGPGGRAAAGASGSRPPAGTISTRRSAAGRSARRKAR